MGKTTLFKNIAYLVKPISGKLLVFNSTSYPQRGSKVILSKIGFNLHEHIFQCFRRVCNESVFRSITGFHEEKVVDTVKDSITLMDLSHKIDEPIKYLSGGQQRRVAIARTMAQGPKLILADEFLSELDDKTANSVWNIMQEYVKENKITLIIVEHNIQRALLADRCLKLEKVTDSSSSILVEVDK